MPADPPIKRARSVDAREPQPTLAAWVRDMFEGMPWSKARGLVETGRVLVDGHPCYDDAFRPLPGARIEVDPRAPKQRCPPLEPDRMIHVDHEVVVVHKPAGLLSVPFDSEADTLIDRTRASLRRLARDQGESGRHGERDSLFVVQRLDKQTTGLLVFARTRQARKRLEAQFRAHSIMRRYLALTAGRATPKTIESWLVPDAGDGKRGSWRGQGKPPRTARWACTHVRVEERFHHASLVACQLETGRQHQIRIHMAEAGAPLLGERIYGKGRVRGISVERPMLHAASLGFRHPQNNRNLHFEVPPPDDFSAILGQLRRDAPED